MIKEVYFASENGKVIHAFDANVKYDREGRQILTPAQIKGTVQVEPEYFAELESLHNKIDDMEPEVFDKELSSLASKLKKINN